MKNLKMIRISRLMAYEFASCDNLCQSLKSYAKQCEEEGANCTVLLKRAKIKLTYLELRLRRLRRLMNAYKDINGGYLADNIKATYADFNGAFGSYWSFFLD